ncbi:putative cyclin-H [Zophobas morio]|uniref:putative cyclin-H n=1 Tax=Zophobas morio TaxID=2755281 RepID=UPI00308335DC
MLRSAVSTRPCLLAKRVSHVFRANRDWCEVECDTSSSSFANFMCSRCLQFSSGLTIDLIYLLEGVCEEELPESIFAACTIVKPSLALCRTLHALPLRRACVCGRSSYNNTENNNSDKNSDNNNSNYNSDTDNNINNSATNNNNSNNNNNKYNCEGPRNFLDANVEDCGVYVKVSSN